MVEGYWYVNLFLNMYHFYLREYVDILGAEEEEFDDDEDETPKKRGKKKRGRDDEDDEPKAKKKKGAFKKLQRKMRKLMEIVIQYEDQDGRVLSDPFMKLPTRAELPDYYEVIRKPVDISKMLKKIEDGKYEDMDAVERDFMLLVSIYKIERNFNCVHEFSYYFFSVKTLKNTTRMVA